MSNKMYIRYIIAISMYIKHIVCMSMFIIIYFSVSLDSFNNITNLVYQRGIENHHFIEI